MKNIITRKIQIAVCEKDAEQRRDFLHTIYAWRDNVRRAANTIVAHKFCQENIKDFIYLKDEIKEKFYVKNILKEGPGMSEQNTTYRVCSDMLKGKVPADIYSCLNQAVANTYKETRSDLYTGKATLRSYKNNIPVPFSKKAVENIHWVAEDKRFYFNLFGIPFVCILNKDRSNNRAIIDRCITGEYDICGSSFMIDDSRKKIFLLLTVSIPTKELALKADKAMYAFLGVMNPLVCTTSVNTNYYDKTVERDIVWEIGTADEFNHRRRQIQEACKRAQISSRYSVGGNGRKKKTQAVDRFHDKESNYVDTKLHTYSRMLIDLAIKHNCGKVVLLSQKVREDKAKEENQIEDKRNREEFVLRNWSYYGFKQKIAYKAKAVGIELLEDEI